MSPEYHKIKRTGGTLVLAAQAALGVSSRPVVLKILKFFLMEHERALPFVCAEIVVDSKYLQEKLREAVTH